MKINAGLYATGLGFNQVGKHWLIWLASIFGKHQVTCLLHFLGATLSSRAVWKWEVDVLGSPSQIVLMVSVNVKQHWTNRTTSELGSCVKVEEAVLGSPSLMASVDVKQHWTSRSSKLRICVKVEEAVLGSPSLMISVDVKQHWTWTSVALAVWTVIQPHEAVFLGGFEFCRPFYACINFESVAHLVFQLGRTHCKILDSEGNGGTK